jgi:hypothetical protein
MKKLLLTLFSLALSCSGTCSPEPEKTVEPDIEIISEKEEGHITSGTLLYEDLKCDYAKAELPLGPFEIKERIIKNVYQNFKITYKQSVSRWNLKWDYIFVNNAKVNSIQGDELDFINWAKVVLDNQDVIWYKQGEVFYNGTINIDSSIINGHMGVDIEGVARSPSEDTLVAVDIEFLFLTNCEEE